MKNKKEKTAKKGLLTLFVILFHTSNIVFHLLSYINNFGNNPWAITITLGVLLFICVSIILAKP